MDFESVRVGIFDLYRMTEMPTYNKRFTFGETAALSWRKRGCNF